MRRPVLFLQEQDYSKLLELFDLDLVAGQLQQIGSNQIAFTSESLKNKNLKIGSEIGKQVNRDDSFLPGKYVVSGELNFKQTKDTFFLGIGNSQFTEGLEISHFVRPKPGQESQLNQDLLNLELSYPGIAVETQQTYYKYAEQEIQGADFINNSITTVVSLSSIVSVVLLIVLFINSRINEIATLLVLGYSYNFVYSKVFLEALFKITLGWFIGMLFSQTLFSYLNYNIFEPRAIRPLSVLESEVLLNSSFIPLILIIVSLTIVIWKVNKISLVELVNPH